MSDSAVAGPRQVRGPEEGRLPGPPPGSPSGASLTAASSDVSSAPGPGFLDREGLRRVTGLPLAAVSGLALAAAFPALGLWPLAPLAVAGLSVTTRGRPPGVAALFGLVFGLAFFVPHLHWSGIYVGALPWFALSTLESLFLAAMAALLPTVWRLRGGPAVQGLAVAGLWVAQEAARSRIPFGGFPWGRLAFSQADAPTLGLAALGGAPLVTAAVAGAGGVLAAGLVALPGPRRVVVGAALGALVVLAVGTAVPRPQDGREIPVAAVQGNVARPGLDFNAERRAVLDNHVAATVALAARVRSGRAPAPELVIWPENASDIDPLRNPDAAAVIQLASQSIGVPLLVGAVLREPVGELTNAGIVYRPGSGPGARYAKQHPAPFAEYVPYRSFFRRFSDKVDLVRLDFHAGSGPGVLPMGRARVGDVICFEVAYDGLVRDTVRGGATLLAVQTNNATFGYSDESVQQLAMSRLRAVESGRSVVHISTVGISALIRPDGSTVRRSAHFRQDVLQAELPLRTAATPATRVGSWPEALLAILGLGLGLAGELSRRSGRRRTADAAAGSAAA